MTDERPAPAIKPPKSISPILGTPAGEWYLDGRPAIYRVPAWDQRSLDYFESERPVEQLETEQRKIRDIFEAAAGAPTVDAARAWSERNGLRYVVYYNDIHKGYYFPGSGVVAVSDSILGPKADAAFTAGVLVHEIVHAQQDTLGLLACASQSFIPHVINTAFTEAHAYAFQRVATAEARRVMHENPLPDRDNRWLHFTDWYAPVDRKNKHTDSETRDYPDIYGRSAADSYAYARRLIPFRKDGGAEFIPEHGRAFPKELRTLEEEFMLLNKDFNGRPWFKDSAVPAFMKKAFDPVRAARFWNQKEPHRIVERLLAQERGIINPLTMDDLKEKIMSWMIKSTFAQHAWKAEIRPRASRPYPSSSARVRPSR